MSLANAASEPLIFSAKAALASFADLSRMAWSRSSARISSPGLKCSFDGLIEAAYALT
jgi:hypothetical protein